MNKVGFVCSLFLKMFIIFLDLSFTSRVAWLTYCPYEVESDVYFQILPTYIIICVPFAK